MNIYLEKLVGLALIILGVLYYKRMNLKTKYKGYYGMYHGYIASFGLILFGIILLFGLRGVLKH
ncbi:MAG: hypothetical protein ABIQ27_01730 [Flavobacterium sp.]|uniref:hypothetical protein n=1 Tax=Flavobacterium sp. TaxID=239 RepID=UPI0032675803